MPKFEKVDANTIRIIVEKSNDVPLAQLLDNKKQLLEQKKVLETTLKNIDEILTEAKKLGIVAKEKPSIDAKPDPVTLGVKDKK